MNYQTIAAAIVSVPLGFTLHANGAGVVAAVAACVLLVICTAWGIRSHTADLEARLLNVLEDNRSLESELISCRTARSQDRVRSYGTLEAAEAKAADLAVREGRAAAKILALEQTLNDRNAEIQRMHDGLLYVGAEASYYRRECNKARNKLGLKPLTYEKRRRQGGSNGEA